MPRSYFCQLPGRSPGTAWTVSRDTRLLPGLQIWGLAPEFAATFCTGFSIQKIFRERLFSGIRATAVEPASRQPSKRVGVRELCIDAKRPLEKEQQSKQLLETERQLDASQKEAVNALHFYAANDCRRRRWVVVTGMWWTSDATQHAGDLLATPLNKAARIRFTYV